MTDPIPRCLRAFASLAAMLALGGCATLFGEGSQRHHAGSAVAYLYPDASAAPQMRPTVTHLRPPVRVGIAFAPGDNSDGPTQAEQAVLLERVRQAFTQYPFIAGIEVIPNTYLRPRGGFDNLEQAARMFNVEVVALVSYDQVQFNDSSFAAVLYWTVVGAYVIRGDRYDVQTMVDTAVFDVASRKLLFRAPGVSESKGNATMASLEARSRNARGRGFDEAIARMIPALQDELGHFRERIKEDPGYRVENRPGYAGDTGIAGLAAGLLLAWRLRRRRGLAHHDDLPARAA